MDAAMIVVAEGENIVTFGQTVLHNIDRTIEQNCRIETISYAKCSGF